MAVQQTRCRPGLEPGPITTVGCVRHAGGSECAQHISLWLWVPGQARDDSGERGDCVPTLTNYFLIFTPLVVNRCARGSGRTGRRVTAALPVPGG